TRATRDKIICVLHVLCGELGSLSVTLHPAMSSLATNVCAIDDVRIRHTLPSWLRVFGAQVSEVVVLVDEEPPSGRIAMLHGGEPSDLKRLHAELDALA